MKAMTIASEGNDYYIERSTRNGNPPDQPQFTWNQVTLDNGMPAIKVVWHTKVDGQPGSHFFVQFRRKGKTIYIKSEDEFDENFLILRDLEPNQLYEIGAVVVDCDYFTENDPEEVEMYADGPYIQGSSAVASTVWFIGMMLALALLLLVLVLVCIIKRNRDGKYLFEDNVLLGSPLIVDAPWINDYYYSTYPGYAKYRDYFCHLHARLLWWFESNQDIYHTTPRRSDFYREITQAEAQARVEARLVWLAVLDAAFEEHDDDFLDLNNNREE
ncbi:neuroglian-like [Daphnia carinata]|uniref:neuroglian-like n=1 Tax=Daphnia carinata TaxID=120202 RepID=UPI002868CC84|nr:neuroglian-like [Daphnia carinata]